MSGKTYPYQLKQCMWCKTSPEVMMLDPDKLRRWNQGEHVQNVWPEMSAGDRELLISGTHDACWQAMFSEDEDDES